MNQTFVKSVTEQLPKLGLLQDEPMKKHTTFRIGGPADYYAEPDMSRISKLIEMAKACDMPVTVIGNGSNLLVGDGGIRGIVMEIGKQMAEISIEGTKITAGAGAMLSAIASKAAAQELTGLEFASGIPGSLGGAVVMNAGAYGGELKDVLTEATVLTPEGTFLTLPVAELDLSYRHSIIPERGYLVVSAVLELHPGKAEEIRAVMEDLKEKRVSKQPLEYPSAGSTFKRPEGYFAGKLIQDAGLKGYQVGDAQVSEKHSGFVINRGNATAADVMQLISDVADKVKEQFGVTMEPEVKRVGRF